MKEAEVNVININDVLDYLDLKEVCRCLLIILIVIYIISFKFLSGRLLLCLILHEKDEI